MARILLPNNCSCTKPIVIEGTSWEIRYRFHDPLFKTEYPEGKQIRITGLNWFKKLSERRQAARALVENELEKLSLYGYNPIRGQIVAPVNLVFEIAPDTVFVSAIQLAYERFAKCESRTANEMRKALKHIKHSIRSLRYDQLPVSEVRRRHIRFILDHIGVQKKGWTASNFNHYRAYLQILFNELQEVEATDVDPVSKIKKMKMVKKIRTVLTMEERVVVNGFLKTKYHSFWRFMQVFFHSGARISELLRVKVGDVDLKGQRFKATILKGSQQFETWKTIKDLALPFWQDAMEDADPELFVFSKGLKPGKASINMRQITKRWRLHVKQELGIKADFYSLKHSHSSEVVDLLSDQEAAKHNSHLNTGMVVNIYDTKRAGRQHNKVKGLDNPFV